MHCFSQNVSILEESSETLMQNDELSAEAEDFSSELYETLENVSSNPINLNTASKEQFEKLYILSPFQIKNIIDYREKNKGFKSIYELASVKEIDIELAQKIMPYIIVVPIDFFDTIQIKNLYYKSKNKLLFLTSYNIEEKAGYTPKYDTIDKGFIGSPIRFLSRYRFNKNEKIAAGFTIEKDAGEKFLYNKKPEFISGFIAINQHKIFKKLVLGDFTANFGEGLVMWNGFSFGKSSILSSVGKSNHGINQYTSSSENNYLRGLALTSAYKKVSFSLFVSYKPIDARLTIDTIANDSYFSSFKVSGLHNTLSEIESKGSVDEFTSGYNVSVNYNNLIIGSTGVSSRFDKTFQKSDELYNYFSFSGKSAFATGVYCRYLYRAFLISGEQAFSQDGGLATTANINLDISDNLKFVMLSRSFNKQFYSRYNRPFAENSSANNEMGIFTGIEFMPLSKFSIKAYSDIYKFPWIKYRVNSPSIGHEYMIQSDYNTSKNFSLYFRLKTKTKDQNISNNANIHQISNVTSNKYRLGIRYALTDNVQMKNILEFSHYHSDSLSSGGFFICQDATIGLLNSKLKIEARYSIFNTDDYYSAIYIFENNVISSFSFPALSGKGLRTYFMIKADIFKDIEIGLKYSMTQFSDRNSISDGITEIKGNRQSDLVFRLTVNF